MSKQDSSRFIPVGIIRSQEQIDIQTATCKVLLVEANAGAAKTTTLALRIGEALANNVAPERMLALVFTETARGVIRQRLLDIGISFALVNRINIATFEQFSEQQLSLVEDKGGKFYPNARFQSAPLLKAIEKVHEHYRDKVDYLPLDTHSVALTQYLDALLNLKARMKLTDDFDLEELETVFSRLNVTTSEYLIAVEYERIRLGNTEQPLFRGPFDTTYDLAKDISKGYESLVRFSDYSLVVCDELHDLNEAAFIIICALIDKPRCRFVGAGDKDQVIHATLGASPEFLATRFNDRFPNTKKLPLTITYRYSPHLAYPTQEFKNKEVESYVTHQTEIKISHYDGTWEDGANRVIDAIVNWRRDGFAIDGCAILIRDRHQSISIENALRLHQIGYRTPIMGSYLQREEILFLRGVIAIALRDFAAVKTREVKNAIVEALDLYGNLSIDREKLESAKKELAEQNQLHWFYDRYIHRDESSEQITVLDRTIRYVMGVSPDARAADVLREICTRMRLVETAKKLYVRPYDASVVAKSLHGFIAMSESNKQTLQQFWESINSAESFVNKKREKNIVTLDCVANSKGKEFDHVIMPFIEVNEFPNPMFRVDEEENLFYVGFTRTRSRLTLITSSDTDKRSPFIARMKILGTAARANIAAQRNENMANTQPVSRRYLKSNYSDKDILKSLGAKYDPIRKAWYVPVGIDLKPFDRWL